VVCMYVCRFVIITYFFDKFIIIIKNCYYATNVLIIFKGPLMSRDRSFLDENQEP
jgi:hypothetical protein